MKRGLKEENLDSTLRETKKLCGVSTESICIRRGCLWGDRKGKVEERKQTSRGEKSTEVRKISLK